MKSPPEPPNPPSKSSRGFPGFVVAAWICVGTLLKWDLWAVHLLLAVVVALGLWAGRRVSWLGRCVLLVTLVWPAWRLISVRPGAPGNTPARPPSMLTESSVTTPPDSQVVGSLVTAEETSLTLAPRMRQISRGLMELQRPGESDEGVFAQAVDITDLGPPPAVFGAATDHLASHHWPTTGEQRGISPTNLWSALLDSVAYFDHARVFITSGEHPNGDLYRFEAAAGFEALARMKSGEWRSFQGSIGITWQRAAPGAAGEPGSEWLITAWRTKELHWTARGSRMFVEALDSALRTPEDLSKARQSQHYQATVKYYRDGMKTLPHPYFAPISVNQKEGVSVVDIDGDRFDDIYITVRLGKNLLLHNRGDGTFTEEAAAFGLDLPGHTTCAIFADFDNDGDQDVILGRSLLKSTYLENRGGKFHQLPIPDFMPMAAISMAAADYNGDGLLDVYICTYRPAAPMGASPAGGVAQVKEGAFDWPDEFFAPAVAREYKRRTAEHRQRHGASVLDQLGPPNVLLINRGGGRFEPAPENDTVGIWRNSLQATWCDYNGDGRPDLYIANDWGLDVMFRNEGPAGFKDVSVESGLTAYGFAMGAAWGDYDNDGREDLYVSNMYSEAGRRMTARIPGLDPMFVESAAGNWLYHHEPDNRFKQVAGLQPPAMTVMNAGWSWGGGFADFDNDSFLDLYVLSGYFTAPRQLDSGLDLESNLWRTMVRSDENLARPSFRFAPEWKRTAAPDNRGPEIDARLSGVERVGDRIRVHSLNGSERNHFFSNRGGRSFADVSGLSGLDNPADSRGFAVLDYDHDGWQDIALVNANQPLFNLYHNEIGKMDRPGGMIAIRFVGGSRLSIPAKNLTCRDGYGARVTVDLGDQKHVREHRCGEGWAAQNSATMMIGLGPRPQASSISVRWPSGSTTSIKNVPEGTLVTAFENAGDNPAGEAFTQTAYRIPRKAPASPGLARPIFPVRQADTAARPARLRAYITFTTSSEICVAQLPKLRQLKERLGPKGIDLVAVPIDETDDNPKLAEFARKWKPSSRLVNLPVAKRAEALTAFAQALGEEPPLPATVITDDAGHIISTEAGIPSLSDLLKFLDQVP